MAICKVRDEYNFHLVFLQCEITDFYVRWDPCPHSMARPRVADEGTASSYGG
jgi:hypothetical protein